MGEEAHDGSALKGFGFEGLSALAVQVEQVLVGSDRNTLVLHKGEFVQKFSGLAIFLIQSSSTVFSLKLL